MPCYKTVFWIVMKITSESVRTIWSLPKPKRINVSLGSSCGKTVPGISGLMGSGSLASHSIPLSISLFISPIFYSFSVPSLYIQLSSIICAGQQFQISLGKISHQIQISPVLACYGDISHSPWYPLIFTPKSWNPPALVNRLIRRLHRPQLPPPLLPPVHDTRYI